METRDSIGRFAKGNVHSAETRKKISESKTVYSLQEACCGVCGKVFQFKPYEKKGHRKFCSKACNLKMGKSVGSTSVTYNGYVREWNPEHPVVQSDGQVLVHRKVWYDHYGEIPKGYHVHHKNEDKKDNRIQNLELIKNGEHQKKHHSKIGTLRKNQYGEFPILNAEERIEEQRRRSLWRHQGTGGPPPKDWKAPPRQIPYKARS